MIDWLIRMIVTVSNHNKLLIFNISRRLGVKPKA